MAKTKVNAEAKGKATSKAAPTRVPFGGYAISFTGRADTLEGVFGSAPLAPSAMTQRLWAYVNRHPLAARGEGRRRRAGAGGLRRGGRPAPVCGVEAIGSMAVRAGCWCGRSICRGPFAA